MVLERIILSPTLVNVVFRLYTLIRNAHIVFLSFCSSQTMLSRICFAARVPQGKGHRVVHRMTPQLAACFVAMQAG